MFVADYIEPGRNQAEQLDLLRKMAFENLDETVLVILEQTINYLKKTNKRIDVHSIMTRDYYKELLRSKTHE